MARKVFSMPVGTGAARNSPDLGRFIGALAKALTENVGRLELAVDRVAGIAMTGDKPNRELVVAFQAFDRLKQEFEALGETLRKLSSQNAAADSAQVIGAITVSELKNRLNGFLAEDLLRSDGETDVSPDETLLCEREF